MPFWNGLCLVLGAGLLAVAIYAQIQRNKLPVRFETSDELGAIRGVVIWAQKQIGADDPRRKSIDVLDVLLLRALFPIGIRISAQDVALLAPFIDQFIAGQGSPWLLSADYDDLRPQILGAFKARMKMEGLWPEEARTANTPTS